MKLKYAHPSECTNEVGSSTTWQRMLKVKSMNAHQSKGMRLVAQAPTKI